MMSFARHDGGGVDSATLRLRQRVGETSSGRWSDSNLRRSYQETLTTHYRTPSQQQEQQEQQQQGSPFWQSVENRFNRVQMNYFGDDNKRK
jgi:hypothetical protein